MILLFVLPIHLPNRIKWLVGFIAFVIAIIGLVTSQVASLSLSFLVTFILSMLCAFLLFKNERLNAHSFAISEDELINEIDVEIVPQNHKKQSVVEQLNQQKNKEISDKNEGDMIIEEAKFLTTQLHNEHLIKGIYDAPFNEEKIDIDFERILSKDRGERIE